MDLILKHLDKEIDLGLERIEKLLNYWNNPQKNYKVILVTGTNGKGSVTSYISSILKEEGFKVGSFFSPHVVKYNERIRIDGKNISDKTFRKYEKEVVSYGKKNRVTVFEAITGIAYKYFSDEKCDFVVMEIGLGGRNDATNVAEEVISVITNIEFDHTNRLGKGIEEIAYEKTGIIKKGTCITAAKNTGLEAIRKEVEEKKAELKIFKQDFYVKTKQSDAYGSVFEYIGYEFYDDLEIKLAGRYQVKNASLAIMAAEELGISKEAIKKGLKKATNKGRLEIIATKPLIVVDAAHNPHGIGELIVSLNLFNYKKLIIVFGVMKDKEWQEMIRLLAPHADLFICTEVSIERSAKCKDVYKIAKLFTNAQKEKNPKKAVELAKKKAGKNDMILVCGSIYLLGEILDSDTQV